MSDADMPSLNHSYICSGILRQLFQNDAIEALSELTLDCVEILSSGNTSYEIEEKKSLYFSRGAKEVWICDEEGNIRFYTPGKEIEFSTLFPDFPIRIEYDT